MSNKSFGSRLKHAWNAFLSREPTVSQSVSFDYGVGSYYRPDRVRLTRGNERSIVTSIFNRLSLDVASVDIEHVRLDDEGRFKEIIDSGLNNCLTVEANIDQTGRMLVHDLMMSMLDEGYAALVPTDTTANPNTTDSYDILTMRVGKIIQWYPQHVKVNLYNEKTGKKQEVLLSKETVSIVENPFYAVVNEPNSTMQRLMRKLALIDIVDEQTGSGKLDLIIQLPYTIKSPQRRAQAEQRRKDIEMQLASSKYGIAYTDGTEHITQLNRSVENNLLKQIEFLTSMLYSQLGLTTSIMDGTADENTMTNYYDRTIEPFLSVITEEMKRKFLSKTARSQHQSILFFKDPFKLIPTSKIAELADKLTRNEIMTSNEIRAVIGLKPSDNPEADELRNKNLSKPADEMMQPMMTDETGELDEDLSEEEIKQSMLELDEYDRQLNELEAML